jgi:putative serine protease PepD
MKASQRARVAGIATAKAAVTGGTGFAVGTMTAEQNRAARPPDATAPSGDAACPGYAKVVCKVLPSVVLIHTSSRLSPGAVLGGNGRIVTSAHVAGDASGFGVQLVGDPQPRQPQLVGTYPAGDFAVIRAGHWSGLEPASFGDPATLGR